MPAKPYKIAVFATPGFNLATTMSFIDPFRVANYLNGHPIYQWDLYSLEGGLLAASNGIEVNSLALKRGGKPPDMAVVSASWTPEESYGNPLDGVLRRWARFGTTLVGLDTGAFILGASGLLNGYRATAHYEHIDALIETFPDITVTEDLYVVDRDRLSACGGLAASDLALQVLRARIGDAETNAVARYVFHDRLRPENARQLPGRTEPLGAMAPQALRRAIQVMEDNLEESIAIPSIASRANVSQRQLERLFRDCVGRSPTQYYSDIRLDRARGLVTQTEIPLREVAYASGFNSPEHFSRAYKTRFGLPPMRDRHEGRVPFEFRAWPMHPLPTRSITDE